MTVAPATSSTLPWQPVRQADATLVAQLAEGLARRIDEQGLRPGTRLPSIRKMAEQSGVSRFTVVEAYDRLVARGLVQSRRGAGFSCAPAAAPGRRRARACPYPGRAGQGGRGLAAAQHVPRNLRPRHAGRRRPVAAGLAGSRNGGGRRARGGPVGARPARVLRPPAGFLPLRQQIAASLQGEGVPAHPERNLLTTNGVTHALDLIARHLVKPGDTVLVEDPAWFLIFGRLAAFGARLIGVPRGPDGPDTALLDQLAAEHKPKLFIINSAVHNPTGHTLSAGIAYEILRIAERHDFLVVEDDTYGDLHPGGAMKLAVLDRLRRVILVSGYSKMLAASLRVGYVAAHPDILQKLADLKMLAGLTSPELGERVIHRVLMEGQYRRHAERVRARVDEARRRCVQGLTALGLTVPREPHAGMFVWADCGRDSEVLAREAADQGLLLAPGTLFSPSQAPSSMVRFSVTMVDHNDIWAKLEKLFMPGLSCNNNGQHST